MHAGGQRFESVILHRKGRERTEGRRKVSPKKSKATGVTRQRQAGDKGPEAAKSSLQKLAVAQTSKRCGASTDKRERDREERQERSSHPDRTGTSTTVTVERQQGRDLFLPVDF